MTKAENLSRSEKIVSWFLPNVGDFIFVLVLMFLLGLVPDFIFGDGSTGWHLVTGEYILQNGVPYKDIISYSHPGAPWVAYEWLSDLVAAALVRLGHGELSLLAVCVSCAIAGLMLLLYERCRKEGANFALALVIVLVGTIISAVHWLARPHIFSFFGVFFFTTWLEDFWHDKISARGLLVRLSVLMILWVNLHPAFLFGFALTLIYLGSAVLLCLLQFGSSRFKILASKAQGLLLAILCCAGATLVNPYGFKLHEYVLDYLKGSSSLVAATHEFLSPVFHGELQSTCLEILFGLFIIGLAVTKRRTSLPRLITCLAFSHLTLSAVRNMPLFVIVILPAISQLMSTVSLGAVGNVENIWWAPIGKKLRNLDEGFNENESLCSRHLWPMVIFVALIVAAMNHGQLFGKQCLVSGWNPRDKPTATLDYLRDAESKGELDPNRGFNYDNWGGYLRYRLGTRVLIDDRADFYGEKFYSRYVIVSQEQPGWRAQLDGQIYEGTPVQNSSVQWVLMPKASRICEALRADPNWGTAAKEDQASALFVRKKR